MEIIVSLASIILINLVLSGDNAVVIAMASRHLPPNQQRMVIIWSSIGDICLRILLTMGAATLIKLPYLQFFGGLLLVWIALRMIIEDQEDGQISDKKTVWTAVKTIIIADLVMSMDNTLAIAAVAYGNNLLLIMGLLLSIPIVVLGSQIIVAAMKKMPVIVYLGAVVLAWTAGQLMIYDPIIGVILQMYIPTWVLPSIATIFVLVVGIWCRYRKASTGEVS